MNSSPDTMDSVFNRSLSPSPEDVHSPFEDFHQLQYRAVGCRLYHSNQSSVGRLEQEGSDGHHCSGRAKRCKCKTRTASSSGTGSNTESRLPGPDSSTRNATEGDNNGIEFVPYPGGRPVSDPLSSTHSSDSDETVLLNPRGQKISVKREPVSPYSGRSPAQGRIIKKKSQQAPALPSSSHNNRSLTGLKSAKLVLPAWRREVMYGFRAKRTGEVVKPKKKRKIDLYSTAILKTMRKLRPVYQITNFSMVIMNDMMKDIFGRLTMAARQLMRISRRKQMNARDVKFAVKLVFPSAREEDRHSLANRAQCYGMTALKRYADNMKTKKSTE